MSEYQYIEFQAVDRPLTDAELAYARKQSTRAEISRWSFQNHYHFGDFHGDVKGLLRRGYDVHIHYANFGIRTVALRLSAGYRSLQNCLDPTAPMAWFVPASARRGGIRIRPTEDFPVNQLSYLRQTHCIDSFRQPAR